MSRDYNITVNPQFRTLTPFIQSIPRLWAEGVGEVIYRGRNELRLMVAPDGTELIVKRFRRPNIINRLIYGTLRHTKGRRSFDFSRAYIDAGVPTPMPVAHLNRRNAIGLLDDDYYVSLRSSAPLIYSDLFLPGHADAIEPVMKEIARVTARIHSAGLRHLDYGRGNILWQLMPDGTVALDIVDVNRQRRGPVGLDAACRNLERLPMTPEMRHIFALEYATIRGFDPNEVERRMQAYRSTQPGKIDDKY